MQEIGFSGDSEGSSFPRFDQLDKQGTMMIREDISQGDKESHRLYKWRNGKFQGLDNESR